MTATQIILPARLASTRLKEKLLQKVAGKSVLQHTYETAMLTQAASNGVIVAVDDPRIADEVDSFGGRWIMTPKDCASGTDRIAFVAGQFPDIDIFVNVQSDEPEIAPQTIDAVARALAQAPSADMATAGTPIRDAESLYDPGVVKIVMADFVDHAPESSDDRFAKTGSDRRAGQGRAVYFSRSCVPHDRDGDPMERLSNDPPIYWHHLGLYAYRSEFLKWFSRSPPSTLEKIEKLEQLRAIEAGKKIVVAEVGPSKPGIDTAEDLEAFRRRAES